MQREKPFALCSYMKQFNFPHWICFRFNEKKIAINSIWNTWNFTHRFAKCLSIHLLSFITPLISFDEFDIVENTDSPDYMRCHVEWWIKYFRQTIYRFHKTNITKFNVLLFSHIVVSLLFSIPFVVWYCGKIKIDNVCTEKNCLTADREREREFVVVFGSNRLECVVVG